MPQRVRRSALVGITALALAMGCLTGGAQAGAATGHAPFALLSVPAAPATIFAAAAPLLATQNCAPAGQEKHCSLYAKSGTVNLPGSSGLPVWGFTSGAADAAGLVGPTLVVSAGDAVRITLNNTLTSPVSLDIPDAAGLSPVSDASGAGGGGTQDYTFTASRPGTYLYEAGPTAGQKPTARDGTGRRADRPADHGRPGLRRSSTAFTDESVLVLSDVDPALNKSTQPGSYDMRTFAPTYRLINGQAYPNTDAITAAAGGHLLLRMVNAGSQDHALALFGPHQRVISDDSSPLSPAQQYSVAAETIGAGQSLDSIVDIPATAVNGLKYVLADSGGEVFNPQGATPGGSVAFGGMMTTITVGGTATPAALHSRHCGGDRGTGDHRPGRQPRCCRRQ